MKYLLVYAVLIHPGSIVESVEIRHMMKYYDTADECQQMGQLLKKAAQKLSFDFQCFGVDN